MPAEPNGSQVRPWLAWYLGTMVPSTWRIIPTFTEVETPSKVTVNITHTKIDPHPTVPHSDNLVNECKVRVVDPKRDNSKAEDALDGEVLELIYALKASERVAWQGAEKIKRDDTYLGWEITVQVITTQPPD